MTPPRRISHAARADLRNRKAEQRNDRKRRENPLFDQAGILEQVVSLEAPKWTALAVAYDDLARGIERYEIRIERDRREQRRHATYVQMLIELIGQENVDELLADYNERWRDHASMQQMSYRLDHLCRYLERLTGRSQIDLVAEAKRREEEETT